MLVLFVLGCIESQDDFYLMGHGLAMLQTSNIVLNNTLYEYVKPLSVPAWVRVRLANQMSSNASQWGYWFHKFNSGVCYVYGHESLGQ